MTTDKELLANLRTEMDAWFGLLNKIDKELSASHLKHIPKNNREAQALLLEADTIRQRALKRIGEIEERLGLR